MNFIQRAIKNVTRRSSKSIILAVTFFLIGNLVIIGLGINMAAENAKVLTRQKMKPIVTYQVDWESYYKDGEKLETDEEREEYYKNQPKITMEDLKQLMSSDYVFTVNKLLTNQIHAVGFEAVPLNNEKEQQEENNGSGGGGKFVTSMADGGEYTYVDPNISIDANVFPDMIELQDGTYKILDGGRFYNQSDIDNKARVVVIEKRLAELNGLRVGDKITLNFYGNSWGEENPYLTDDIKNQEFEVIGIYETNKSLDPNDPNFSWMSKWQSPYNKVLMPASTLGNIQYEMNMVSIKYNLEQHPDWYEGVDEENMYPKEDDYVNYGNAIFLLKDPLNVDSFINENSSVLKDYLKFDANDETFKKLARPLDTLSLFSNIIVWIVTINAIVIISLVTALTLKTREYEIGVLLSMGVTKGKIVGQLFLELIIVALIGFTLAVASGSLISKSVGAAVLDYQVSNQEEVEDNNNGGWYYDENNYFTDITQDDMLSNYEVTVGPLLIAEIYILGIAVVFISILIPSGMIMRFNPKRILTNIN